MYYVRSLDEITLDERTIVYVNLTMGIEWLPTLRYMGLSADKIRYIRVPSTWCEQGRPDLILLSIDADFLARMALGYRVVVVDASSRWKHRHGFSRALWMGVQFVEYVANRLWFNHEIRAYTPPPHSHDITRGFMEWFRMLPKPAISRIRYFRRLARLGPGYTEVYAVSLPTQHDGDDEYIEILLKKYALPTHI